MQNPRLDETSFQALGSDVTNAFLRVDDAIGHVRDDYESIGLVADPARPAERRVVRVADVPAGTKLFKLTHWQERWQRDTLSPWWSNARPFAESDMAARTVFETALLNGVNLREYVRFASAVSLDWNLLDWYVEITLTTDVQAYWGQFAPQAGTHGDATGTLETEKASPSGDDTYVHYDSADDPASEAYLPAVLGGVGAWQLYIPAFSKHRIDPQTIVNIASTASGALAAHFGVSAERVEQLVEESRPVRDDGV